MKYNNATKKLAMGALIGVVAACSPVKFSKDPSAACNGLGPSACVEGPNGISHYMYDQNVPAGKVDILLVNDNSGSMQLRQQTMGAGFGDFVSFLNSHGLNWQLTMVSTDIGAPFNPSNPFNSAANVAIQNGKLIAFGGTTKVLSGSNPSSVSLFQNSVAITTMGYGDSRGIYAANLAVQQNENSWIRGDAHLAVIILSDADERNYGNTSGSFALETLDTPSSFVDTVKNSLGATKTLSVHSIVTRTGDTACANEQRTQGGGYYGKNYEALANMTGGTIGNVCATPYTSQLTTIGNNINNNVNSIRLACVPLVDSSHQVVVTLTPAMPGITSTVSGQVVSFSSAVPSGTNIHVDYYCQP